MPNVREQTREPKKASWRLLIVFSCNVCDRLLWAKCAAIRAQRMLLVRLGAPVELQLPNYSGRF